MTKLGVLATAAILATAACGGEDDDVQGNTDCNTFTACGGELEGTWTVSSGCVSDFDPFDGECDTGSVDTRSVVFSGNFVFGDDGKYTATQNTSGSLALKLPNACLEEATSCDELNEADLVCTGDATVQCICARDVTENDTEAGTFTTSANTLTLITPGGSSDPIQYCVEGNVLKIHEPGDDDDVPDLTVVYTRE